MGAKPSPHPPTPSPVGTGEGDIPSPAARGRAGVGAQGAIHRYKPESHRCSSGTAAAAATARWLMAFFTSAASCAIVIPYAGT